MPAAEDGEWNNWCSNVVCVRTKSSKESENDAAADVPVINVRPIVVKTVYRSEPATFHPLPPPPPPQPSRTVPQRRRITRLIQTAPLLPPPPPSPPQPSLSSSITTPIHYEGVSRVSFSLKSPVSSAVHDVSPSDFGWTPYSGSRHRISVPSSRPLLPKFDYHVPESFTSGRTSLTSTARATSLPPSLSSAYLRRSSIATVPSYTATSGYTGRPVGTTGSASSYLRRGSVDVSSLSRGSDYYKSPYQKPILSGAGVHNTYRRGSLSVLGTGAGRPTYRSSTAGRLIEDEFKPVAPFSAADSLSSLRQRTQHARDKLDVHRSLLDRYLPPGGASSRATSVDSRFTPVPDRRSDLESFSRRASLSTVPRRPPSVSGSRAPSLERSDLSSFSTVHRPAAALHPPQPPATSVSPARRRIRDVLYKVSGDSEFLK